MEAIFTYILKVNGLLILFYLIYKLALSKETFYQYSRWFLLSGLFVSVLLPFVTFTKIEYYEVKEVLETSLDHNLPITTELIEEPILTNQEILFFVYGIICFGFLIKTMFDFFKLFKIIKVSNSEKKDKLVYINTNLVHTPFSFFNYIVYNEELINPIELQNIIKHEEAHSMQKHSFDTLLAQFFIILFWFNPMVWLYRKSMVQNLEFLADSYAIQQVSDKEYYQKTMLKITTQSSNITMINTFNQSSIKKRIIMLNTNQSNRKNIWKIGLILPIIVGFIYLFQVKVVAQEKKVKFKNEAAVNQSFYIFESHYDDSTIKSSIVDIEKKHNLTITVKDIKRNSENKITGINLTVDNRKGKKIFHVVNRNSPIDNFAIKIIKKNNEEIVEIVGKENLFYPMGTMKAIKKIDSVKVVEEINFVEDSDKTNNKEIKKAKPEIELSKKDNSSISQSDVAPEPQNGMVEFRKYVAQNFRLPEVKNDVDTKIVAKFIVSKTGEILDITILSESPKDLGLGEELTRILKASPSWKPGTKDGKPADLYFLLPVAIQIQSTK